MRTQKTVVNVIVSLIYQAVAIICGLITPRLILGKFGSEYNGVISSATQFLSMISILTLGIAGPTRVALYRTLAADDKLGTSRIVKATNNYMRKVACGLIFYSVVLMIIYPVISHNELQWYESALIIAIVSFGTFMEYFFGTTSNTLLTADQRQYIYSFLQIIATILNTVCVAILIKLDFSVFVVKFVSAFLFALTPLGMSVYVRKKYCLVSNCMPDDSAIKARSAAAFHSIANIVHDNTDLMILTVFTSAKEISVYTVYYFVVGKIKMLMRVFTNGLEAAFGNMWAQKEYTTLKDRFRLYEVVMYTFVAVVFSCVGILIVPFVIQYTKGINDVNYARYGLGILITITEGIYCIRQPYLTLVQACGYYEETKNGAILEAVVNLVASIILVYFYGIIGVIVGTLLANIIRTTQYMIFTYTQITHENILYAIKQMIMMMVTVIATVSLSISVLELVVMDGWMGWICKGIITFIFACLFALLSNVIFNKKEIKDLCVIFFRKRN